MLAFFNDSCYLGVIIGARIWLRRKSLIKIMSTTGICFLLFKWQLNYVWSRSKGHKNSWAVFIDVSNTHAEAGVLSIRVGTLIVNTFNTSHASYVHLGTIPLILTRILAIWRQWSLSWHCQLYHVYIFGARYRRQLTLMAPFCSMSWIESVKEMFWIYQ